MICAEREHKKAVARWERQRDVRSAFGETPAFLKDIEKPNDPSPYLPQPKARADMMMGLAIISDAFAERKEPTVSDSGWEHTARAGLSVRHVR